MNSSSLDWQPRPLAELVERKFTGPSPTCEERQISSDEEWGLLKTTAVTWSGWDETAHKVPPTSFWANRSIEVRAGDVLVTKAGPRHRVGVVVHVQETRPHLMVSGKMVGLRPKTSLVLPTVLAGLMSIQETQDYLNSRTTGMAESQTNISDDALLKTILRVPPMEEQVRISAIVQTFDRQMQESTRIIKKLGILGRGLVADLLSQGIDARGRLRSAASDLTGKADADNLPIGWDVDALGRWLAENPKNGYSPVAVDEWTGVSMLGLGCISRDGFAPSQLKNAPRADSRITHALLNDGDLLMTRANTRDLVGLAGVYRTVGHPCSYPDLMMRLVPTPSVIKEFLMLTINSDSVRRQVMNYASGTSGSMVKVSGKIVRGLKVAIPPLAEQKQICDQVDAHRAEVDREREYLSKLRAMRQGLLSDLLTGGGMQARSESFE